MTKRVYSKDELSRLENGPEMLAPSFDPTAGMAIPFSSFPDPDDSGSATGDAGKRNTRPNAKNDTNGKDPVIESGVDDPGDATAKGNVLTNDRDKDGDKLTVRNDGRIEGEFGTLKLSANGKYTYTLDNSDPDTDGLAEGETAFEKFKYTVSDGHGGKDTAVLKIKITGSDDTPAASITLDPIAPDNIVNGAESVATVSITGTVGGAVKTGDIVTLTVNGNDYSGAVSAGAFSIAVAGADLAADGDKTIDAKVTADDGAGHTNTVTGTQVYTVDTTPPDVTIEIDTVTADNIVNVAEAGGDVAITGTVTNANNGDTVIVVVNGKTFTGTVASGSFSVTVPGADLAADGDAKIEASVTTTDEAGNSAAAIDTQTYTVDATLPSGSILLNAVTADNVVNTAEAAGTVNVTGVVGGDFANGQTVTLTINGKTFTGQSVDGAFSIAVSGADLAADSDKTIEASVGTSVVAEDTQAYTVDVTAPAATIALDAVTADNIINATEASGNIAVTGTVGGDVRNGDTVSLEINGTNYTGAVSAGSFSISVLGSDLAADSDKTIAASVTTSDTAGNTTTASDTQLYAVDTTLPSGSVLLNAITSDNVLNAAETEGNISVTGVVGGDFKTGDTVSLTVNGKTLTGTVSDGTFSISVLGSDLAADSDKTISASVATTDTAGNPVTASDTQTYGVDITPPAATITLDPVAGDGVINQAEFAAGVKLTGTVGGDVKDGDTVRVLVNAVAYEGTVTAGKFSVAVLGTDLAAASSVQASVTTADEAGNATTANAAATYTLDVTPPEASVSLDAVAGDDLLTDIDVFGIVSVSGVVGGEVPLNGSFVTVEANNVTYSAEVIEGAFSVAVNGADIVNDADQNVTVTVSVTDDAGNTTTATDVRPYTVNFDRDLTTLLPSQGFVVVGTSEFGPVSDSVSSVGDINGDGFADVVIGASRLKIDGSVLGGAFVVFGSDQTIGTPDSAGRNVFDLDQTSQTTGFGIIGESLNSKAGLSVSDAGDVNGDGFDDLIVGAPAEAGAAGKAFVIFGTDKGFSTAGAGAAVIQLSALTADLGFVIDGDGSGTKTGFSVSSAGDINGDGFDDLIVGAPGDFSTDAGQSYVIFGTGQQLGSLDGAGRAVLDLATLSADNGFVIAGAATGKTAGYSVSSAGDINGDGFGDLIVGAPRSGANITGEAYVVFGTDALIGGNDGGRQVLDVATLSAAEGFVVRGQGQSANFAISVSSAGDVNGDGFGDLVIGASDFSATGTYTGEAYVVFGAASGFGTENGGRQVVDIATLAPDKGFVIKSDAAFQYVGGAVSSAGDVNGDGFDDLIVGAHGRTGEVSGKAFVLFGSDLGFGTPDTAGRNVVDLDALRPSQGFAILGDTVTPDRLAETVSAAGDVNGDGFDDLIVGTTGGNDGGNGAGESYVVFGGAFGEPLAPVTITGDANADTLIGGLRDDVLTGGGGADVFRSGAGNDRISIADAGFRQINGGNGGDTVVFSSDSGFILQTANLGKNAISGIEAFDLTEGANRLDLGGTDAFHFPSVKNELFTGAESHNALVIFGGDDDIFTYSLSNASILKVADNLDLTGLAPGDFDFFNLVETGSGDLLASIAVQNGIQL